MSVVAAELTWWQVNEAQADPHGPAEREHVKLPADLLSTPIFAIFSARAAAQPEAVFLAVPGAEISYGTAHARALALAGAIMEAAQGDGAVVVRLPRDADVAVAMLACLAAGRACLLVSTAYPAARLADIIADARPALIISSADVPIQAGGPTVIGPDAAAAFVAPDPGPGQDEPALVLYTSGSTGRPKGVVWSQLQMLRRVSSRVALCRLRQSDRYLSCFSLAASPGVTVVVSSIVAGATVEAGAMVDGLPALLTRIAARRVSLISANPSVIRALVALPGAPVALAGVQGVQLFTEATLRDDIRAWRAVLSPSCGIMISYGLTEATPLAQWFVPPDPPGAGPRVPVGYPVPGNAFAIAGDGREPGELWVRGDSMALGIWTEGRCGPGAMQPDPADPTRMILRTGDLVRMLPGGVLELVGRNDSVVKLRGHRIELVQIEAVLRALSGVRDAVVLPAPGPVLTHLVAHVVADGGAGSQPVLLRGLREALPAYMVPSRMVFHAALPRTASGKVDAVALNAPAPPPSGLGGWIRRVLGRRR